MLELARKLPEAMYGSIEKSSMERIHQDIAEIENEYEANFKLNEESKAQSFIELQEAMNNSEEVHTLSVSVKERIKNHKTLITSAQAKVFTCLQADAKIYFARLLNATKAGLTIYSGLFQPSDFISSIEKDVKNRRHVKARSVTMVRIKNPNITTQKWKGLPNGTFEISYCSMSSHEPTINKKTDNYTEDIEGVKKSYTIALIKQRDESFKRFQEFFDRKVNHYASLFNSHRQLEDGFKASWDQKITP